MTAAFKRQTEEEDPFKNRKKTADNEESQERRESQKPKGSR